MRPIITYGIGLLLWLPGNLPAQRVIYSEPIGARSVLNIQVIGKTEEFYWVEKRMKPKSRNRNQSGDLIQRFELFDAKLNLLSDIAAIQTPDVMKQWLMAGKNGLDQVLVTSSGDQTKIIRNCYKTDQQIESYLTDSLPFLASPSGLLLVRSADQSKILLVAFENTETEITRVHALLFDSDWHPIYHQLISHEQFSQPCIQDEEIGFPGEGFDNLPIKLANNGEWVMVSPSRISRNFSLFHACPNGSDYYFREIPVSPFYKMEDIAMSIDNNLQEMSVGLFSGYRKSTLKNVRVCNYSMTSGRFVFDTSYHFNTQVRDIQAKNLSHESFVAVPGGGYMLLKEYGHAYEFSKPSLPVMNNLETAYLLANYTETASVKDQLKEGYTLNKGLTPIPYVQNRGDLNLFYFPAVSRDSTWSGIMEMEQQPEINNPDLSYLLVPIKNKLYIIYNSMEGYSNSLATTTTLNKSGQPTDDALVFWKIKKLLNFQYAHRFISEEVAVPYKSNQQSGFAIIKP